MASARRYGVDRLPADLRERSGEFVGREWAIRRIDRWLGSSASSADKMLLVVGGPGTGKSTLMARVVALCDPDVQPAGGVGFPFLAGADLTTAWFCRSLDTQTLDPLRFIEELAGGLADARPEFANALLAQDQEPHAQRNEITITVGTVGAGATIAGVLLSLTGEPSMRAAYQRAILRPLLTAAQDRSDKQLLVLVDALDEALAFSDADNLVALVAQMATEMPANVRMLLTSRPDPRVLGQLPCPTLDLSSDAPAGDDDVEEYVTRRLAGGALDPSGELAHRVATAAGGNFLYARYVVNDLQAHPADAQGDTARLVLPADLSAQYETFLERELARSSGEWKDVHRPLLGAIAVARGEGLGRDDLIEITGLARSDVDDALEQCEQYLTGPRPLGPFRPYHHSFREFLLAPGRFEVYEEEANELLAKWCLTAVRSLPTSTTRPYALTNGPAHLVAAIRGMGPSARRDDLATSLRDLLCDLEFLEAKTAAYGADTVLVDLGAGLAELDSDPLVTSLRRVVQAEAHHLRTWNAERRPAFFAQQLLYRAVVHNEPAVEQRARARLEALAAPHLQLRWRAGRDLSMLLRTVLAPPAPTAVAMTPDGTRAISGHADGAVVIWDTDSGTETSRHAAHRGRVACIAVASDGRSFVTGGDDGVINVCDLTAGDDPRPLCRHDAAVNHLCFVSVDSDDISLLSASDDRSIRLWDWPQGAPRLVLTGHEDSVRAVVSTPGGNEFVSVSDDGTVRLWSASTPDRARELAGFENLANSLAVTGDGAYAVVGFADARVRAWELATGDELDVPAGHRAAVRCVVGGGRGARVISAAADGTMLAWNLGDPAGPEQLTGDAGVVSGLSLAADASTAVTVAEEGTLKLWNFGSGEPSTGVGHTAGVTALVRTPDGARIASGSYDGTVKVWAIADGTLLGTATAPASVTALAVAVDGSRLVVGCEDRTLLILDATTVAELRRSEAPYRLVTAIAAVGQRPEVVVASGGGFVSALDIESGEETCGLAGHDNVVVDVAVTPDGRFAVTCALDRTLRVWDLANCSQRHRLTGHREWVGSVAIGPGGVRAVSASVDTTLRIWDLDSGSELHVLNGHDAWVTDVAIDSAGWILSGAADGRIGVWSLADATCTWMLDGHDNVVATVRPIGGDLAVSGAQDHRITVWNVGTGTEVATLALDAAVRIVVVGAEQVLVAGDSLGTIYALDLVRS